MQQLTGIEKNFVQSWESWDQLDTFSMIFMNCELQPGVARKVGRDFADWVTIDAETSFVQIGWGEDQFAEFELEASLGAPLQ